MASKRAAFTLVEIMIVVLIIGILMAIAVPNFYQARTDSRTKACVSNLRLIETAKEQWALETKQSTGALPAQSDLYPTYMKTVPACPAGGTYSINSVGTNASCTTPNHALPQ